MINCVNGCGTLNEAIYEGVTIDACDTCMGVWLDYSELTHIVKTKDTSWSNDYIESTINSTGSLGVPDAEYEREVLCPKCNENMPPNNFQYSSGVIVNTCKSNHGIWLDSRELDKIQIYMEKWRATAEKDKDKYAAALTDVKAQHDKRYTIDPTQGPSKFEFINAIFLGIMKLMD